MILRILSMTASHASELRRLPGKIYCTLQIKAERIKSSMHSSGISTQMCVVLALEKFFYVRCGLRQYRLLYGFVWTLALLYRLFVDGCVHLQSVVMLL